MNRLKSHRAVRYCLTGIALIVSCCVASPAVARTYAQIEGSGSTWSQVILSQWITDVNASGMKVTYNGSGSSQGRKDFANSVTDFGISEIPYQGKDERGQADTANGREYAYLPIVAGGTAFTYQVKVAGKNVTNLRLSGETIAKIFTNKIKNWNDPAITRDNNGRVLPSLPITPVIRSDGSGTTAQFTRYLDTMYPSIWRPFFGHTGLTSYFPKPSGGRAIAAAGSDQVMNTISGAAGNGTIGYVEYSYPRNAHYPVVKLLNSGGYYVEPTQYNVAVALTKAKINQDKSSPDYLTQILDGVYRAKDARAYPMSSYSYMIIPTGKTDRRMTTAKRQTLADFMYYSLCEGQGKAGGYGYSPLPLNLVSAGFQQIAKLKTADAKVDLSNRSVTGCHNPTFVAGNLSKNHLAEVAPQPAACDKVGAGPCTTGTGTGTPSTDTNSASAGSGKASAAGGGGTAAAGTGGAGASGGAGATGGTGAAAGAIDPETGAITQAGAGVTGAAVAPTPTELVASRTGDRTTFGALAVLELLALVLLPGGYVAWRRRSSSTTGSTSRATSGATSGGAA
ncbi:MAG: phosphate transporter substrate-binding protein PhoT family [Marmoricola sp.]|nr:phosphate transporter substrate-binding protein PhoT family [Marmoricola sp.]